MTVSGVKECTKCGSSENKFYGDHVWCGRCLNENTRDWERKNENKAYWISRNSYDKTLYGLAKGERQKMLEEQRGLCAICEQMPRTKRGLHLDHNHETGQNRGLLCHGCNVAIGNFGDDIELLQKAIKYLKKYKAIGE